MSGLVECVLLNACYSEVQATAIVQHINYAIGMNQAIRDDAAIIFTKARFRAKGKTKVYIDRAKLANNFKQGLYEPVISVNRSNKYISGHEIAVDRPCKVVYNPEANRNPRIWIETIYGVRVFSKNLEGEIISRQLVS